MPTGIYKRKPYTKEHKENIGKAHRGKPKSDEHKRKLKENHKGMLGKTAWNKGIKTGIVPINVFKKGHIILEKTKEIMRKRFKGCFGKNHPAWKGGCKKNERNDPAYHLWRKEVFKKFPKCILNSDECSGYRIAHHIYSWSDYPKLRYKVSNGVTLCQAQTH